MTELESNNTRATANSGVLGTVITGQLTTSSDIDYYRVIATTAGSLSVVFDVPTSSTYSDYFELGVYNNAGTLLSLYATGTDKTYTIGAPSSGNYFIGVSSSYFYSASQYSITVSNTTATANSFESESNNSTETADVLTLGGTMKGQLSTTSDVDCYSVTTTTAGTLSVVFDVPTNNAYSDYFDLGLYNSAGTLLSLFTTGTDKTYTVGAPTVGTYYVGVASNYYYNSGQYSITVSNTAATSDAYEAESNNTLSTANTMALGTAISGQLASNADNDYFKIEANQASVITVTFDAPTNSSFTDYFSVQILDVNGTVIASHETGKDITFQAAVGAAGSYYVKVDSTNYYYNSEQYKLTASVSSGNSGFELEPNNNLANAIQSGVAIRGQVATSSDLDWFVLNVAEAGAIAVNFDAPTSSTYTEFFNVRLYDASGNLLASQATGNDITFNASATVAGNYFVAVSSGDYYHDSGQYSLTVTNAKTTVLYESEINNTNAHADPLALGGQIHGQLSSASDEDRFAITLNSSGTINTIFDSPTNSTWSDYFQISIYDQAGKLLSYRSSGSDLTVESEVATSGTYFIAVSAGDYYYNGGEYKLTVNAKLNDPIPDGAIVGNPVGEKISGTASDDLLYGLGGNDQIDGAGGVDTAVFRSAVANLSINTIEGLSTIRGNYAAGEHAYSTTRLWNVEKIKTYDGTQALSSASISPIIGTLQNDVLIGTAGADVLDGMGGTDFIDGAAGSDTLVLFTAKEKFSTLTVGGVTRIKGSADASEYAGHTIKTTHVENLAFTQSQSKALETTNDAVLFGTSGANGLVGSSENEVFDGQGGNDTVDGGAGIDTVLFFDKADNFKITFPTTTEPTVKVVGKIGFEYANQTLIASNVEFLAFTDRTVSVANAPKLVLTASTSILTEGGVGANLEVSLSIAPSDTVTVTLTPDSQLSANATSLTFDSSNWTTPQTVNVTALDDTVLEGIHKGSLTTLVETTDYLYKGLANNTVDFSIADNGNDLATTGSVSGKLWNDFDKDGSYDVGEARLVGWSVFEDVNKNGKLDSGETQTTTDATGNYLLGNLSPGSHTIIATTPSGWLPTSPGKGSASGTIISSAAPTGKVTVEALTETIVSAAAAQSTYNNLGTATNIAAFHADSRFANINGQGEAVVIIDTGADLDHPYFGADSNNDGVSERIIFQYDFYGKGDANAADGAGHGTHVAGIIGSSDSSYPGVAPNVNLIVLKVFSDTGVGDDGTALRKATDWVVANAEKFNVVAVNLSLGFGQFDTSPVTGFLSSQFQSLANQGVVVVSASGNAYAGAQGVSYPSSDPYSLSVGAVWASSGSLYDSTGHLAQSGVSDAIAVFSQRDDTESDIFAPGVSIGSAQLDGTHVLKNGTSMASPEIAGMVALAQQLAMQELGRRLSFDEIRSLLKSTGDAIVDGDNENDIVQNTGLTFYRADMLALAEAIVNLKPPSSYSVTVTAGSTVVDKDFGFAATTAVQALSGDDVVFGTAFGEELRGGAGSDQINGGAGDDKLYGESGNDRLNGGYGSDQAFFNGNKSNYTVSFSATGYTVADNVGTDGIDTLVNIEQLIFQDSSQNIDTTAPVVITFSPSDNATGVDIRDNIVVTFSESVQRGSGSIALKTSAGITIATYDATNSSNLTISGSTVTVNPTADLSYSTDYKVEFAEGSIKDLAENKYAGISDYNFTTKSPPSVGININANALFWKGTLTSNSPVSLSGVNLTEGGANATTDNTGAVALTGVLDTDGADDGNLTLEPHLDAPNNAKSAITLTDVLATLKVYLNKPLPDAYASPLNYIAADFDGSGTVTLTDVLQLLKYYLNKPTSATPIWQFVDAADMSADGKTFAGANGANLGKDNTTPHAIDQTFDATHTSIELVGVLRGDVDGSWTLL